MNVVFDISGIQSSPASMIGTVYASCVSNSMIYGNENTPLLAEMKMIRWKCVVSMKDRRTSEN